MDVSVCVFADNSGEGRLCSCRNSCCRTTNRVWLNEEVELFWFFLEGTELVVQDWIRMTKYVVIIVFQRWRSLNMLWVDVGENWWNDAIQSSLLSVEWEDWCTLKMRRRRRRIEYIKLGLSYRGGGVLCFLNARPGSSADMACLALQAFLSCI